jgi:hypothetical protein
VALNLDDNDSNTDNGVDTNSGGGFQDTPWEKVAYYSGQPHGASIYPGHDASYVGWFKEVVNSDGTTSMVPIVEGVDGVIDPTTKAFRPNTNILYADEVTFYVMFETASIQIERTNAEPGQSFVYHVQGNVVKDGEEKTLDMYVTLVCGADGTGSCEILEALAGKYTVTEVGSWSWRFNEGKSITQNVVTQEGKDKNLHPKFTFSGGIEKASWLSGLADMLPNVFGKVQS